MYVCILNVVEVKQNVFLQIGDPILRRECDPLDPKDIKSPQVKNIIKCMKFALKRYDGVGISAPQIGKVSNKNFNVTKDLYRGAAFCL